MKIEEYVALPNLDKSNLKEVVKLVYTYCYIPIEFIIIFVCNLLTKKKQNYKYKVSICAIFKNESSYLKEWIDYHHLIGVDHFYLYNNFSDDNYKEVLSDYINNGIVELTEWPIQYGQLSAYQDCYLKSKYETLWLGFIDIDEFVNLQKDDNIKTFLEKFKKYPSVLLCWRMFGTSGYIKENASELVIERYTSCWENLCNVGKSFINNRFKDFEINHPHVFNAFIKIFKLKLLLYAVNDRKKLSIMFKHTFSINHYTPNAYINHYWSKSYERYIYKDFKRGDVLSKNNENNVRNSNLERFKIHELKNNEKDFSILRWIVFLKTKYKM